MMHLMDLWVVSMITRNIKKLWQGKYASVRDTDLRLGIHKGGIKLQHNGESMNLSNEQCETLLIVNKDKPQNMYQSKFKGTYFLVDVEWKPLTHDERQGALL